MSSYKNPFEQTGVPDFEDTQRIALSGIASVVLRRQLITDLKDKGSVENVVDPKDGFPEFDLTVMRHILIGDDNLGGHHLPSVMDLEADDRVFASQVNFSTQNNRCPPSYYRNKQKLLENGTYRCRIVEIEGISKPNGSTMFPNDWSTQDVLQAVTEVAKTEPAEQLDFNFIHRATVDGVELQVITDSIFGRIITGYPIR